MKISARRLAWGWVGLRAIRVWFGVVVLTITASAADETVVIDFRNRIPGVLDAPVYDTDGATPLVGPHQMAAYSAQLFLSTEGPDSLAPHSNAQTFGTGTNAGYWEPQVITLPPEYGVSVGKKLFYSVRVLEWLPVAPFGEVVSVGQSRIYTMVVTNSVMPLVGFESFSLPRERLRIRRQGTQVVVEWNAGLSGDYYLEATSSLRPPVQWQTVFHFSNEYSYATTVAFTNALTSTPQFYRLERWR